MASYYINPQAQSDSGDHEVHRQGCYWLTLISNPYYLGDFYDCHPAVAKARSLYPSWKINGCYHCSEDCHTS